MMNTIKFAAWFLAMLTLTIGFLFTTASPTFATIDSAVRKEQSIVPLASFTSTSDDHFWSLLVAKSARSTKEVPPFRVGRHYITTEKSLWTLSVEQRHHYTMCVVLFDMVMTMGQFFDVADLPPVYDQQLQAVLSRLPAALLYALSFSFLLASSALNSFANRLGLRSNRNATDLSEGGMWATIA
jgi:hypothetical protein